MGAVSDTRDQPPTCGGAEMTEIREAVLHAMQSRSLILSDNEVTWSKKGSAHAWLLDTRVLLLDPLTMEQIARLFWSRMEGAFPFQLACMEMTGIPLLIGIQAFGLKLGRQVNGVIVRKERKSNGRLRAIEGELNSLPVVFVDDILNSGESVVKAHAALKEQSTDVAAIWALVDYDNVSGHARINKLCDSVASEYRLRELNVQLSRPLKPFVPDVFEVVWHRGAHESRYYHVVPKSTPAVDDDRLYYGTEDGGFYALQQKTGSLCWSMEIKRRTSKGIWSSPLLCGENVVFGAYNGEIYAVNRSNGELQWQFSEADWVGSSPCAVNELGIIVIGLEHALPYQQGSIVALNQDTGERVWEFPARKYVHGSPLYVESVRGIVVGSNDNDCVCLDARTGHLKWMFSTSREVKARPVYARQSEMVIFGCFDHHIYALHAVTGDLVWKLETEGIVYSEPLVVGERVYATSTDKRLYVLELRTGAVLHTYESSAKLFSSPALIGERIYFGTNAGVILEYDPKSDTVTGRHQLPERITNKIAYGEQSQLLFITTHDGQVFALRRVLEEA